MRSFIAIICLVVAVSVSGCTTPSAGKFQLYASISKGENNKYKVDTISNASGNVDLNNYQYNGDTDSIICGTEDNTDSARIKRGGDYQWTKCTDKMEFFKEKTRFVNGTTQMREVNMEFSRGRFESALEEALITSKVDRLKTLSGYDSYVEKHDKKVPKFTLSVDKFEDLISK